MVTIDELYKMANIVSALSDCRRHLPTDNKEAYRSHVIWMNYVHAFLDAAELYKENVIQELQK